MPESIRREQRYINSNKTLIFIERDKSRKNWVMEMKPDIKLKTKSASEL